ncbi:MAG: permease [bacterium]
MNIKAEIKPLAAVILLFLACFFLPVGHNRFDSAVLEALLLVKWYAREHLVMCLIPAFFIAGAIGTFLNQSSVMKYLGEGSKIVAYGVASVSGTILAVCSCTVLPLFAGIYQMGAGLGPASAFLYSGPAVNVLAIILTARILGPELGLARAVGAVVFSIIIGLLMHLIFRRDETRRSASSMAIPDQPAGRPLWQNALFFAALVTILVFANLSESGTGGRVWQALQAVRWSITGLAGLGLGAMLVFWFGIKWQPTAAIALVTVILATLLGDYPIVPFAFATAGLAVVTALDRGEAGEWLASSWGFAKQILPLLLAGVFVAGLLLGRPGQEGIIPGNWISSAVGGNSLGANLAASVAGAFMYFATLTEIPILQGLLGSGMGQGPALALLLAGPALSLPNMLVIRSVVGTRKTVVFVTLVVVMATLTGVVYGAFI